MNLPDPEAVTSGASGGVGESGGVDESGGIDESAGANDGASVNVAVAGDPDPAVVDLTDEGYEGQTAGAFGRLAAAAAVAGDGSDVAVHYPDPDFTADGPWLVLAPLSRSISTVAAGTGSVEVTLDYDATADPTLREFDDHISALTEAARPSHEHYPVEQEERGVFTTGMTTFSLDSLSTEEGLRATFSVSTTPATTAAAVESRFADLEPVRDVLYEPVAGVERASPSDTLREAVEAAHREVVGDAQYEWLAEGDVFSQVPCGEKVALGTGALGTGSFSHDEYDTCVDLLRETLEALEVEA